MESLEDALRGLQPPRRHLGEVALEEAVLDFEVRSGRMPRALVDATVHHNVPGDAARLAAAARGGGTVNKEAEAEKKRRYPDGRAPWEVVPFAVETYGRLGVASLKHLIPLLGPGPRSGAA